MNAENVTINKEVRQDLLRLSREWLQDQEFKDMFEEEISFEEEDKVRHWYESLTTVTFPYDGYYRHKYEFQTHATTGSVKTPWFGDKFNADKYKDDVQYAYVINFPKNIALLYPNMSVVLDMDIDTKIFFQ